mmetsp:Transcript_83087/g.158615  ORF Transcript_83087/g.158615 Transcript_83087/m.158615 type:complete len:342 (+) Transcript_83087:49-1074(+)
MSVVHAISFSILSFLSITSLSFASRLGVEEGGESLVTDSRHSSAPQDFNRASVSTGALAREQTKLSTSRVHLTSVVAKDSEEDDAGAFKVHTLGKISDLIKEAMKQLSECPEQCTQTLNVRMAESKVSQLESQYTSVIQNITKLNFNAFYKKAAELLTLAGRIKTKLKAAGAWVEQVKDGNTVIIPLTDLGNEAFLLWEKANTTLYKLEEDKEELDGLRMPVWDFGDRVHAFLQQVKKCDNCASPTSTCQWSDKGGVKEYCLYFKEFSSNALEMTGLETKVEKLFEFSGDRKRKIDQGKKCKGYFDGTYDDPRKCFFETKSKTLQCLEKSDCTQCHCAAAH